MLRKISSLSAHAQMRLTERFSISTDELVRLLNTGLGKRIGHSLETHLIHILLWCPIEKAFLVCIQDVLNGIVLTVLTLDMYIRDYARNVTERRIQKVINMMVHAGMAPAAAWRPGVMDEYVTVFALRKSTSYLLSLGRWRGAVTSVDLGKLGELPEFWEWVARTTLARGGTLEDVLSVSARFSGGELQHVPYCDFQKPVF
ncbi:hypothetical protein [Crenobacter intestini]|uniref:Uncharacterized protein n=1 Tax=Crenobacter intestini TaxID=2563443 RepID=A0A4T0UPP0_9NEIS|nr:hypothetical protein [Crenobacter intestini]TIC80305.1 hypothetical protein E5K04_12425 [Crenobacter intestini]